MQSPPLESTGADERPAQRPRLEFGFAPRSKLLFSIAHFGSDARAGLYWRPEARC